MKIGKFTTRDKCRLCDSKSLEMFLDLGFMPHAGNFLKKSEVGKELIYPLKLWFCKKCKLVQILDIIPSSVLFDDYRYLSSISLTKHFEEFADELVTKYLSKGNFAVEIGSNDGVLLVPLKNKGIKVLGVDPARNVARVAKNKGIEVVVDRFNDAVANKVLKKYGKADAVLANNVLAHIDNMQEVFSGIKNILNEYGVLIFEVHYLPDLLKKLQYDFFYNEHLSYYSLTALVPFLSKFGLEIFNIKKISTHAGSVRVYAKFKNNKKYSPTRAVVNLLNAEKRSKLLRRTYLLKFSKAVSDHSKELNKYVVNLKESGYKIVGYGASGRANTLLNYCKIDDSVVEYIVDDSPERQNRYTPGSHIYIVSPDYFRKDNAVKLSILFAWNYRDQILKKENLYIKNGGKFIVPLPKITTT